MAPAALPYFDQLLARFAAGDPDLERCFGRHVHWGYWPDPAVDPERARAGFAAAAEALSQRLLQRAAIRAGERVLDVGCGFGGTVASLNAGWQGLELTGLNLDPRQIARARRLVQPRGDNRISWLVGDACALPLASASQDVVLAVECIFHFPSREHFLAEVARVLRPGGRLVLSDFVPIAPLALAWRRLRAPGARAVFNATYGPVDCSWDRHHYRRQARRLGLQLCADHDITAHTLPTYPVVRQLFEAMGAPQAVRDTARIECLSRWGLLRYRILAFCCTPGAAAPLVAGVVAGRP